MLLQLRINRIRLEFKVRCIHNEHLRTIVLIESDWNLKYNAGTELHNVAEPVLIESDWNLKV